MPPTSSPFCSHYASYFYGKPIPCQRPAPKEARIDSAQRSCRIFFVQSRWKIEHRAACSADEFPPKYGQKRCTQTTMPNRSVTPYTYVFNNSLTERKRTVNIRKLFSTYTIIISVYYSCFEIYAWLINAVSPVDALKKGRTPPSIGDDAQGRCVPRCYFFRRSSCRTASRSFSVMVFARITARCPSRLLSSMSALFPS